MTLDFNLKVKENNKGLNFTKEMQQKLRNLLCLDIPSPSINFLNVLEMEIKNIFWKSTFFNNSPIIIIDDEDPDQVEMAEKKRIENLYIFIVQQIQAENNRVTISDTVKAFLL